MQGMSFAEVLNSVGNGSMARDLDAKLHELTHDVVTRNGSGEITVKLKVSSGRDGAEVSAAATMKKPPEKPSKGNFFITEGYGLTRQKPNQLSMDDLQDVEKGVIR